MKLSDLKLNFSLDDKKKTSFLLDGKEIGKYTKSIDIHIEAGAVPTAIIEIYCDDLDLSLEGVEINNG